MVRLDNTFPKYATLRCSESLQILNYFSSHQIKEKEHRVPEDKKLEEG